MTNLFLTIYGSIFMSLLALVYFSKKRVDYFENKIYALNIIVTLFGTFLEIFSAIYFINGFNVNSIPYIIVTKLIFIYYTIWINTFLLYIIIITNKKNSYKLITTILIIIEVVELVFIGILPFKYILTDSMMYPSGAAVIFVYIIVFAALMVMLLLTILNLNKVSKKKFFPLFLLIIFGMIVFFIQSEYPEALLTTPLIVFVTFVTYFTIENPDVKMINELELAKKQAEKANAAKSDFLSSMSHEIRTPLNAIVGFSECIKQSDDIAEIHEDIDDVIKASQNLLEIVNGVLDISKIEADKLEIVNVSYNPVEVFNELVKLVSTRIGEKDLEIRCNFAPDIPEVLYGDKSKVKQIVLNLLTNAVKYTDKGYVDLSVSCINKDNKSDLSITVADTGRGIKEEQMSRLFNKFERLDEDRNTTIEGTGLGLAITKALVEMMGGKIIVHSTYGEGSKFTILISQKISTEDLDTEKKVDTSVNDFEGKKVLVVDDNRLNLRVVDKLLKSYKLNVTLIESGFECVNKIENNESYDLIFMDIMMPKMSGVETLKKLKSISRFNIPVVALTADAMEGKANKYIEVGFNDYLSKPIDKEELKRVLNKFLVKKEYGNEETRSTSGSNSDNKVYEAKITDDDIKMLDELLAKSKLEK